MPACQTAFKQRHTTKSRACITSATVRPDYRAFVWPPVRASPVVVYPCTVPNRTLRSSKPADSSPPLLAELQEVLIYSSSFLPRTRSFSPPFFTLDFLVASRIALHHLPPCPFPTLRCPRTTTSTIPRRTSSPRDLTMVTVSTTTSSVRPRPLAPTLG